MDNQELMPNVNTGVLLQPPLPSDFIAGAETGIEPGIRLPSGDWRPFLSTDESQIGVYFDTMACVTFSALNCVEAQMDWLVANNLVPQAVLDELKTMGYFDANGKFNASDRFTAKMSGTTHQGNYLTAVWDSIRNHGILPESDWAYPRDQRTPVFVWEDFYAEIPQPLKDKALRFKQLFDIRYQWLVPGNGATQANFKSWLQLAPIQLATAVCSPWNTSDVIKACSLAVGHATMMFSALNGWFDIEDHYKPYQKRLALDYPIPNALQGVVYVKNAPVPQPAPPPATLPPHAPDFKHAFNVDIKFGERSAEVKNLQDALKLDGCFPTNVLTTGFYGDVTRIAVLAFQKKYRVASPQELASLNGKLVGVKTRAQLNSLFNK